jgi:hypothetical protein
MSVRAQLKRQLLWLWLSHYWLSIITPWRRLNSHGRATGRRVRVIPHSLDDPGYVDPSGKPFDPTAWNEQAPILFGRLVGTVSGYFGLIWYLLELDHEILPEIINPMHSVVADYRLRPTRYLLLSPSPEMPTVRIPRDYIGDTVARGRTARVTVSRGGPPEQLPKKLSVPRDTTGYPQLCGAVIELCPT